MDNVPRQRYLSFGFRISLLLSVAMIVTAFSFGTRAGTTLPRTELERVAAEVRKIPATIERIFLNNFLVSAVTFLPFVGAIWHLFVQYGTGLVFGSLATQSGINPGLLILASSPVFFLEYVAYTVALAECIMLSGIVMRRRNPKLRLKENSWKSLIIVAASLFLGALVEVFIISILGRT